MKLKDILNKLEVDRKDVKFFYKAFVDERPVEIDIIQVTSRGESEIIRLTQILGRKHYAGFWVNTGDIWVKTKDTFKQLKDI